MKSNGTKAEAKKSLWRSCWEYCRRCRWLKTMIIIFQKKDLIRHHKVKILIFRHHCQKYYELWVLSLSLFASQMVFGVTSWPHLESRVRIINILMPPWKCCLFEFRPSSLWAPCRILKYVNTEFGITSSNYLYLEPLSRTFSILNFVLYFHTPLWDSKLHKYYIGNQGLKLLVFCSYAL